MTDKAALQRKLEELETQQKRLENQQMAIKILRVHEAS